MVFFGFKTRQNSCLASKREKEVELVGTDKNLFELIT